MTRRGWLIAALVVACLVAAATYATLRRPSSLDGVIVDAVSGRVAAGATVTFDGRVLRRFQKKEFAFAGGAPRQSVLSAEAPGYEPVRLDVPAGSSAITVSLRPVGLPDVAGIVVFPELAGDRIRLPTRLLDRSGAMLKEFPAVDMTGRLLFTGPGGREAGAFDVTPVIDSSDPEMAIRVDADLAAATAAAGRDATAFMVEISAGGKRLTSRPFSWPPPASGP